MPESADLSRVSPPDDEQLLRVTVGTHRGYPLLTVAGEIDIMTARRFTEALDAVLGQPPLDAAVLCEMSGVTFVGSHGMAALTAAAARAREGGREVRIVVPERSVVVRTFRIGGIDQLCAIHHSLDAAAADALG